MSQRELAEDVIWWSIKNATAFAAHRRTVVLFHTDSGSLAGQPNPLVWVDNTGAVWDDLRAVLSAYNPKQIALNMDQDIAFGGGLHVGELRVLSEELGAHWMERVISNPMLGVEYVARRVPGQIVYYRLMQETIWAMIEEAFSNRVVKPGITTTEVILARIYEEHTIRLN